MVISADISLYEILDKFPDAMPILARHGFHGIACSAEIWLPISIVAQNRGILLEPLLEELNRFLEK